MIDAGSRFSESTLSAGPKRHLSVVLAALTALTILALGASSASASYIHPEATYTFGVDGTNLGAAFEGADSLDYNQANDRLYVLQSQSSPRRIYGFHFAGPGSFGALGGSFPFEVANGSGDPEIAVDNTAGSTANNIYYAQDGETLVGFSSAGIPLSAAFSPVGGEKCGVAVDPEGHPWTGNYQRHEVEQFAATGGPPILTVPVNGSPCHVDIDPSNGDLFVPLYSGAGTVRYTKASGYALSSEKLYDSGTNSKLAINGSKHVLYVGRSDGVVNVYDTVSGSLLESFGSGGSIRGIAVDESTDTVFISRDNKVQEWKGVVVPDVTTGDPVANMTVSGTVGTAGAGAVTECVFEFATDEYFAVSHSYNQQTACSPPAPFSEDKAVTAALPGLLGETTYHYRLVARNASGKAVGADKTITPHNVKGLQTEAATAITRTGAELHASFEGNGQPTTYYFEWGTTTGYGQQSATPPGAPAGSPTFPPVTNLNFTPTNLKPDTTYHFRVVGKNEVGVSPGKDMTFKTLPAVQSLVTEAATEVKPKTVTLNGSYLGDGTPTSYYYEYGKNSAYGSETPVIDAGSPSTATSMPAALTELALETTYHYRVVATNALGTTKGLDQTFTTKKAVEDLTTLPATDITQESVLLHGEYTGNNDDTHYYFEYGPSTAYGQTSEMPPGTDAGETLGATQASTAITAFEGYTTYHYRIVAENSQGKSFGNDQTFDTLPALLPVISGTSSSGVSRTAASVSAQINPNRWKTSYSFEFGSSSAYGSSTPLGELVDGNGNTSLPVSAHLLGLVPATQYHFRVVAINFQGTSYGPDQVFTTPDVPRIEAVGASAVGQTKAHLTAAVAGNAAPTDVHFEFGTDPSYGSSTGSLAAGAALVSQNVDADLSGLRPGTTYHARAVAINALGTTNGQDITFTTDPAPVAEVEPPKKPKCKKNFVKKHGKCVKRKKHKKNHRGGGNG